MREQKAFKHFLLRATAEIVVASIGAAFFACAIIANQRFLDRHFVPSFFLPRHWYVVIENLGRLVMAALGVWLVTIARARAGRFASRAPVRALHVVIATVLALGASNLMLRRVHLRPYEWLSPNDEPRRQLDPRLGWRWIPRRSGHKIVGGRAIDYAIDPAGYRVSRVDEPVDLDRPTILFTGESVMFGEGLTWEETIPAQVGTMMGMQTANLAVHGYGNDQAYLRLQTELPRFHQPVAVVSLFMTALFGRNLDQDRPHLGPGLVWLPAEQRPRLSSLAKLIVPYRADTTVDRGVAMTRDVLRATSDLVQAHGATPLLVVPQFGQEQEPEQALRRRILDDARVPYVFVEIDSSWRLPWDRHPNARAAHAIASAIATELRRQLTSQTLSSVVPPNRSH
ncbi:MAG: hypothetical protein C5B58_03085 [Acidobacteria bacterium]|nr:MAG: hypothetical protein C5B58_03085 [Acidobacteriota bacterium]